MDVQLAVRRRSRGQASRGGAGSLLTYLVASCFVRFAVKLKIALAAIGFCFVVFVVA